MSDEDSDVIGAGRAARGLFVTGTGTGVGKTIVAAAIARDAAARGLRVAVFKPALTGLDEHTDRGRGGDPAAAAGAPPDHELLRAAAGSDRSDDEIAPYRFGPAVSPHLAAELAKTAIDPARLVAAARDAATGADLLVCEGVGGLLVPLTEAYSVRDFARELGYPLVVAAAPGLGTINHTLLTLEAARSSGLDVRLVVMTPWPAVPGVVERSNRETIARLGDVAVSILPSLEVSAPEGWPGLACDPLALGDEA